MSRLVGGLIKRKEDARLILGRGEFLDDISLHQMLHGCFLRSPYGHARIVKINVEGARKVPGVIEVFTGADLFENRTPKVIPTAIFPSGSKLPNRYPIALNEVSYLGEPVALVVAENSYVAEDALEKIEIEYEPLEAMVDPEKAMRTESARAHE